MKSHLINTERHPLEPFLPEKAKILMLGSFPPQRKRWSMEFFYPNAQNDMWRIMGTIFYGDKHYFEIVSERRFDRDKIVDFCQSKGIALYDTAVEVRRLKDNASDKFLEIVHQQISLRYSTKFLAVKLLSPPDNELPRLYASCQVVPSRQSALMPRLR